MADRCYACDNESTSVEHIPPRCLFPEQKDLPPGVDLRKQLLTVPSCDEHNSKKSDDDEYLLFSLVINLPNNQTGTNHFLTKILRAIEKFPGKFRSFMKDPVPVVVKNEQTGEVEHTIGLSADYDRLENMLCLMGRALYSAHYGGKWGGRVRAYPNFILAITEPNAAEINEPYARMAAASQELLAPQQKHGENPEVFSYQIMKLENEPIEAIAVMRFYEGSVVTLLYGG